MNAPKHTPGPWVLVHDEPYEMAIEADGKRVPGLDLWLDDACFDLNHERLANATLAATAPELLQLLTEAIAMMPLGTEQRASWITRAWDVRKKAEGR